MNPLLLLAPGRSGSTYTMQLLARHPAIVADETYPLECRAFLAAVFPGLPTNTGALLSVPEAHAFYRNLAARAGKAPRYFVEKCPPQFDHRRILAVDPAARFLALVRDPRDILVSVRAFERLRDGPGMYECGGDNTDALVIARIGEALEHVCSAADTLKIPIARYEDLVANTWRTLAGMLDVLGLETAALIMGRCLNVERSPLFERHATAASAPQSVGRWRAEMPAELAALATHHLSHVLDRFGYPRS